MPCEILKGVRIVDFGSFVAGPAATQYLGFLGAEVIKVEHPSRPDGARLFTAALNQLPPDPRTAASQVYSQNNLGKQCIAVDYATEEGRQLVVDLVRTADVVCENMSVGALERHGLGYTALSEVKPDLIYLASSSCGEGGPDEAYVGYASTFACKAGLGALTGYEDSPPSTFVGSIDVRSATNAALAMLGALYYRAITGRGQRVEISSQEAIASQLGDVYLDCLINGNVQGRMANARPGFAPQGAYRTDEDDSWIALSVETEAQWCLFCEAMENQALATDCRFASLEARFEHRRELDALIDAWTAPRHRVELLALLQQRGVPSGPVYGGKGTFEDLHRIERESYYLINNRDLGKECVQRPAWRYG
ncbi:CaiB/BaiF CoA transferase family protein, partial [Gordonibacter sp.]